MAGDERLFVRVHATIPVEFYIQFQNASALAALPGCNVGIPGRLRNLHVYFRRDEVVLAVAILRQNSHLCRVCCVSDAPYHYPRVHRLRLGRLREEEQVPCSTKEHRRRQSANGGK